MIKILSKAVFRALTGIVLLFSIVSIPQLEANAEELTPSINVYPDFDQVEGVNWPVGNTVTVTVDADTNPYNGVLYQSSMAADSDGMVVFNIEPTIDLISGLYVWMSDDTVTKSMQIAELYFDSIDTVNNTASGRGPADEGAQVNVLSNGTGNFLPVLIDGTGNWLADFGANGVDLQFTNSGNVMVSDVNGNSTGAKFSRLLAKISYNRVECYDWTLGHNLNLKIHKPGSTGGSDYEAGPIAVGSYEYGTLAQFNFGSAYILEIGDQISVTDGDITKSMTVSDVVVTKADRETDTVEGTAFAGASMRIHGWTSGSSGMRFITADGDGKWIANYSIQGGRPQETPHELRAGDMGMVNVIDENGYQTDIRWWAPDIDVDQYTDSITGYYWPMGSSVTLYVNGSESETKTVTEPLNNGDTRIDFDLAGVFDLQTGDVVRLENSLENAYVTIGVISVTEIDCASDFIIGTATPNSWVYVALMDSGNYYERHTQANSNGAWFVDFASPGTGSKDYEQATVDIQPGIEGSIYQRDPIGEGSFSVGWIANDAPSVALSNKTTSLPENTSTVKVADITITDDGFGDNVLSLSGADASLFEITGDALYIKVGSALDFETNPSLDVTVNVDDTSVGTTPDDSESMSIALTNVADFEIVKNGGFETYSPSTSKKPASWVAVKFSTLDGKNTTHQAGKYSVKLAGAGTTTKTLTQTITKSGLATDSFAFSYWVKGSALPKTGICQGQVILYKTGGGTVTKALKCPTTATTFTWKQMKLNFTASANYSKVVIIFTFKKTSGAVWFDGVSLKR